MKTARIEQRIWRPWLIRLPDFLVSIRKKQTIILDMKIIQGESNALCRRDARPRRPSRSEI